MILVIGKKSIREFWDLFHHMKSSLFILQKFLRKEEKTAREFHEELFSDRAQVLGMTGSVLMEMRRIYDEKMGVQPMTRESVRNVFVDGSNKLPVVKKEKAEGA